jgi:hypothetical protein
MTLKGEKQVSEIKAAGGEAIYTHADIPKQQTAKIWLKLQKINSAN